MASVSSLRRAPFLVGVFLISFAVLTFQILQTRILSAITWYYLAFFAISVAMLGMTVGAVWAYLRREQFRQVPLPVTLSRFALLAAVAMPASMIMQLCLITTFGYSLVTIASWSLMLAAMAIPYVFSGVVVSLALTRSPFPAGQVYGVDLLGAALGCAAIIEILNRFDAPTATILVGVVSAISAAAFDASVPRQERVRSKPWWQRPSTIIVGLAALALFNFRSPVKFRPIMVKDDLSLAQSRYFEKWNTYSRITATPPTTGAPRLYGPSPLMPATLQVPEAGIVIDGDAATNIYHYDGTPASIDFLRYDVVDLAYRLPGIHKSAVIGVGGGCDVYAARAFGVSDITAVELNPIIIDLDTRNRYFEDFSNLALVPNLKIHVDDARSWFAATHEKFDLVQMSMIDTWAATGAGAFSLSENGLYTLEGWRAFLNTLTPNGVFTVSRWYGAGAINETGRLVGLAMGALIDAGIEDPRQHIFVATANDNIATLVLSKSPLTFEQLLTLHGTAKQYGFSVLLAPDQAPQSDLLRRVTESQDMASLNSVLGSTYLDLTVPTDSRPFFFNQLRVLDLSKMVTFFRVVRSHQLGPGVARGNLIASIVLVMILGISIVAALLTILVPLKGAAQNSSRPLVLTGSLYFALIGMGFMLAEIALLQYFSVYLGHPVYALGVCLFSLILSTGLGSLTSEWFRLSTRARLLVWGVAIAAYLAVMAHSLPMLFQATTDRERMVRIGISLAAIMPLGFLLGFAFPTGIRLVEAVDKDPTPWFWGINGATGVLASVLGVIISMSFGINVTLIFSAACYLLLIPAGFALIAKGDRVKPNFELGKR